ncbi:MAG: hypothetical protein JWM68_5081, partial [Verrucomicrobiales bacterium]|nr:hypothetical protein [Verrucomicrobiales bacterium]
VEEIFDRAASLEVDEAASIRAEDFATVAVELGDEPRFAMICVCADERASFLRRAAEGVGKKGKFLVTIRHVRDERGATRGPSERDGGGWSRGSEYGCSWRDRGRADRAIQPDDEPGEIIVLREIETPALGFKIGRNRLEVVGIIEEADDCEVIGCATVVEPLEDAVGFGGGTFAIAGCLRAIDNAEPALAADDKNRSGLARLLDAPKSPAIQRLIFVEEFVLCQPVVGNVNSGRSQFQGKLADTPGMDRVLLSITDEYGGHGGSA